jgi:hypothetical protein
MKIATLCDVTPGSELRVHRLSEELGASPINVGKKKIARLLISFKFERSIKTISY